MIFAKEGFGWDLETLGLVNKDTINPNAKKFIG